MFCAGFDLAKTIPLITGVRVASDEWDEALLSDLTLPVRSARLRLRSEETSRSLLQTGMRSQGAWSCCERAIFVVIATKTLLGLSEVKLGRYPGYGW